MSAVQQILLIIIAGIDLPQHGSANQELLLPFEIYADYLCPFNYYFNCAIMDTSINFYAPPQFTAPEIRGTVFHKEILAIAFPGRNNIETRRWRLRKLNKFRFSKLLFLLQQKDFVSRTINYFRYKQQAHKTAIINYVPPSAQMESSTGCLLKCPGCLVGTQNATGHPAKINFTRLEVLKKEIDLIAKKCFQLYFHMHAEPLLNPSFFEACRYAVSKGLWTGIHSNLMPVIPDLPEKIIDSGLCNLVVSIDGATQETYEKYRTGGDLAIILGKIKNIAALKKQKKTTYPWITAKFLVFEHNWHEIKMFKEIALENGADEVIFISGYANGIYASGMACTEYEFNLDELAWKPFKLPERCPYLWEDLRIDTDGGLFPCGNAYRDQDKFFVPQGAADLTPVIEQLNTPAYLQMRRFFLGLTGNENLPEPCNTCQLVKNFSQQHTDNTSHAQ